MKNVMDLSAAAVNMVPVPFDWDEGYGEAWDNIFPSAKNWTLARCKEYLEEKGVGLPDAEGVGAWRDACDEFIQGDGAEAYTPMMNYYYPLPNYRGDAEAHQGLLDREGGAVCLVRMNDEVVLALTGGDMDLSWDICHAHMLLGYLPPFHFCDLPGFAGLKLDEKTQWILDGRIRSAEVVRARAVYRLDSLREYKKGLRQ